MNTETSEQLIQKPVDDLLSVIMTNDEVIAVIDKEPSVQTSPLKANVIKMESTPSINEKSNALSLISQYSGSESEDEENGEIDSSVYRKPVSESSSSCSSDSEEEKDVKVIERKIREPVESDGDSEEDNPNKKKKKEPLKVKGELSIDDLPPIQDLQITVDARECMEIGYVTTIVDQLVLVEALRNSIPLDIDSVLFLENGKHVLGQIFDVIGPVHLPIYCIRFNNHEEIVAKGIVVGTKVFCAPRTEHSSFVILSQISKKGSDASWKNDIEPPDNMVEYSDDEQERRTKRKAKANRGQNSNGEQREFVRGRRYLPQSGPGPAQPGQNLAYPNYSWHNNINQPPFPHQMNTNQNQYYQNYPQ